MKKRFFNPQKLSMPHCPSHNPTKDISSSFIGRKDSVVDQEGGGPAVISDDPDGNI
jgi:hypothetical protein